MKCLFITSNEINPFKKKVFISFNFVGLIYVIATLYSYHFKGQYLVIRNEKGHRYENNLSTLRFIIHLSPFATIQYSSIIKSFIPYPLWIPNHFWVCLKPQKSFSSFLHNSEQQHYPPLAYFHCLYQPPTKNVGFPIFSRLLFGESLSRSCLCVCR